MTRTDWIRSWRRVRASSPRATLHPHRFPDASEALAQDVLFQRTMHNALATMRSAVTVGTVTAWWRDCNARTCTRCTGHMRLRYAGDDPETGPARRECVVCEHAPEDRPPDSQLATGWVPIEEHRQLEAHYAAMVAAHWF